MNYCPDFGHQHCPYPHVEDGWSFRAAQLQCDCVAGRMYHDEPDEEHEPFPNPDQGREPGEGVSVSNRRRVVWNQGVAQAS